MKNISELTEQEIDILAATWAEKFKKYKRSRFFYKQFLNKVIRREEEIDSLPHFLVKLLIEWGFNVNVATNN